MEKKGAPMLISGICLIVLLIAYIYITIKEKGKDDLDLGKNNFNRMIEKYRSKPKKS